MQKLKPYEAFETLITSLASCFRKIYQTHEANPQQEIPVSAEIQAATIQLIDATRGFLRACLKDGIKEGVGDMLTETCSEEANEYPYEFAQALRILFSKLIMQICEMEAIEFEEGEAAFRVEMQKIIAGLHELSHVEIAELSKNVNSQSINFN